MTGVVVGMSRAAGTTAAVHWASAEAALRGLPLRLVHAWDTPLNLSIDLSPDCLPGLGCEATAHAVHGPAPSVLLAEACDLLVLGGHTGARRLSHLTRSCLRHAACPVVIVPDVGRPPTGCVLVGVNGSETSRDALRWAADEARRRLDRLVVLYAWQVHPNRARDVLRPARAVSAQRGAAHDRLHGWVQSVLGTVDAELIATHGGPLDALLHASAEADLLVLGHRTRSGVARLLGGAVASDLTGLAPCPVALIPRQPASANVSR
ncbi:MAG TPA: universal stress protein [Streptosporangiaceae bacterium]|nr:universal stress protein [Streptosporangiaceae bacterium]